MAHERATLGLSSRRKASSRARDWINRDNEGVLKSWRRGKTRKLFDRTGLQMSPEALA
jgi:hypothetical protein